MPAVLSSAWRARRGIQGAVRGKRVITTLPGRQVERGPERLDRGFVAAAPNRCRVADFTQVKTRSAAGYVAFVVDAFPRRAVGPAPCR
ncbi:hypothetical protein [Streptomyces caeruleatus]|uniref:hypothetical protein n=1 Tax=Streptomyces caeruleatus TaxID=661399 RepID=UPI00099F26C0|nr:hypothetical protein [Streptomyces caeruleatus]